MNKLYDELAEWWPLLSAPSEYATEAAFFHRLLSETRWPPARTLLELGSGGGNTASHLKAHYTMTLVDESAAMLTVSCKLNPECEHIVGDMRTLRLGRTFDAVFVHDAIMYMTSTADLRAAILTAFEHCRPGGVALFAPDFVRETFAALVGDGHEGGGHDGDDGRGLRYLEWSFDPDPNDKTFITDFAIILREPSGEARVVHDRHIDGLFLRAEWLSLLSEVGFEAGSILDEGGRDVFMAVRPP